MQNGDIESFDGKFRDDGLNAHWFRTIENWRLDYNEKRPHSSISNMTPALYALTVMNNGGIQKAA